MWGNKKPERLQTDGPERRQAQTSEPTNTNKEVKHPTGPIVEPTASRVGSNLCVKGEISGNDDLYVDGTVEGLIQLGDCRLTVGTTANVTADIIAGDVIIYGKVRGNVCAKGRVEIRKDGSVDGDLTMAQILIEDGANFKGSIRIERTPEKQVDKDVLPPAA
jgi:cytoskeletal protein CcmA (bactofilin family)